MDREVLLCFRDQFRFGKAVAVKDAEGFSEILFTVERLGSFLSKEIGTLNSYLPVLQDLACDSPLARELPKVYPGLHLPFYRLYQLVMQARNDALHQGAYARHLTSRAIELSIVLEDALMNNLETVAEFMVRDPLCCSLWQPLSLIRQQMLANSFSFLPVRIENCEWRMLSDQELARYLRVKAQRRKERLAKSLKSALTADVRNDEITLLSVDTVCPTALVEDVAQKLQGVPVLVTRDGGQTTDLVGIITAFDLL
jgi:CBS domain-containing protein